jgi:uncharacterized membrane protein
MRAEAATAETTGFAGVDAGWFDTALHWISLAIEIAGVAAIVVGALVATTIYVRKWMSGERGDPLFQEYRQRLGRGILLGLEFLVAADIIGTVAVEPTLENLYVLGLLVLIRTFLSFSLETELEGRLPWRKGRDEGKT